MNSDIIKIVTSVLLDSNGRILLIKRANKTFKGAYGLPGGKVKDGENMCMANIREHQEELGIKLKSKNFLGDFEFFKPAHAIVYVFLEKIGSKKLFPDIREVEGHGFYDAESIKRLKLAPNHRDIIDFFLNNK